MTYLAPTLPAPTVTLPVPSRSLFASLAELLALPIIWSLIVLTAVALGW